MNTWDLRRLQDTAHLSDATSSSSSAEPRAEVARTDFVVLDRAGDDELEGNGFYFPSTRDYWNLEYRPTSITLCTSRSDSGKTELAGMQLFNGFYYNTAGAAHGDLTGDCRNYELEHAVVEIDFFLDKNQQNKYVGISIETQPLDGRGQGTVITAGVISEADETDDLTHYRHYFPYSGRAFWGFQSSTSADNVMSDLQIIRYDEEELNGCTT